MGWEKYIVLESREYELAMDSIYRAFQKYADHYTLIKEESGLTLFTNASEWPEVMQISVEVARQMDYAVNDGEKYIYCLFYIGGNETDELQQTLVKTLDCLSIPYTFDDL